MITVLLIDDEPAHRLMVRRALLKARPEIAITEAETLEAGCAAHRANPFKLAIVDLNLAGESGLDFIRFVRTSTSGQTLPIIVISTSTLESDVEAAYAAGANIFVFKTENGRNFPADIAAAVAFLIP